MRSISAERLQHASALPHKPNKAQPATREANESKSEKRAELNTSKTPKHASQSRNTHGWGQS
jgi:hypothetical protein